MGPADNLGSVISQLIEGRDLLKDQILLVYQAACKLDYNFIHRIADLHLQFIFVCG